MYITILQENFLKSIQDAGRFTAHKTQLPSLTGIYCQAKNGIITLRSTDLHIGYQTTVGAKVIEEGECVLPSKIVQEFISSLLAGPLELKTDKDSLTLIQGKKTSKIPLFSVNDFPPFPEFNGEKIVFDAQNLTRALESCLYAASLDETRPVLASILWDMTSEGMTFVCTDGYRLSCVRETVSIELSKPQKLLLPAKGVGEITSIINRQKSKKVSFGVSNELSQSFFFVDDSIILLRLVDGEFPPYEQVIPRSFTFETGLDREEWMMALKTALVFAKESSSIISLLFEDKECIVRSASANLGEQETRISSSTAPSEQKKISFNGRFLLDVLTHLETPQVIFKMTDELKPGVILAEGSEYPVNVVMPFKR
ncbi:DNA polymerase III subunit beta [Candidatus Cerribacteria bacterium 'Amazon FNV 2010 28 9']|uniref:Beta sliding clamp n=1 Tax=Candidatus Cerribacteria bacterium 'Amazon FNV 2010 28 9' TaxID=2081795 RepID=A0A317JQP2_9BACT|nr:MAG: DNA polymerase III subunit beta [Candidatus Cerribacteria bacterium 'Amazon FNV 2010 28 9']